MTDLELYKTITLIEHNFNNFKIDGFTSRNEALNIFNEVYKNKLVKNLQITETSNISDVEIHKCIYTIYGFVNQALLQKSIIQELYKIKK